MTYVNDISLFSETNFEVNLPTYIWHYIAQSCPTLCNPVDCSPPGSSVQGILQARILEWVAISFSRGLPDPWVELRSPTLKADALTSEPPGKPSKGSYTTILGWSWLQIDTVSMCGFSCLQIGKEQQGGTEAIGLVMRLFPGFLAHVFTSTSCFHIGPCWDPGPLVIDLGVSCVLTVPFNRNYRQEM